LAFTSPIVLRVITFKVIVFPVRVLTKICIVSSLAVPSKFLVNKRHGPQTEKYEATWLIVLPMRVFTKICEVTESATPGKEPTWRIVVN